MATKEKAGRSELLRVRLTAAEMAKLDESVVRAGPEHDRSMVVRVALREYWAREAKKK